MCCCRSKFLLNDRSQKEHFNLLLLLVLVLVLVFLSSWDNLIVLLSSGTGLFLLKIRSSGNKLLPFVVMFSTTSDGMVMSAPLGSGEAVPDAVVAVTRYVVLFSEFVVRKDNGNICDTESSPLLAMDSDPRGLEFSFSGIPETDTVPLPMPLVRDRISDSDRVITFDPSDADGGSITVSSR
jgi:hypothetical protein